MARVDTSIQRLIDDLTDTMLAAPGAGLAAHQIGVPLRVCVVKGDDNQIWGLVNPEIVKHDGVQVGYEGCLSYPGWVGEVARHETVVVKGDDNQIWGLVNPEIVKHDGVQVGYEGCLSYPGWVGEVARHETVVVKGRNRRGKEVRIKSTGFTSRAFQHELDHLDGVLFIDRLTSLDTLRRVEDLIAEAKDEDKEEVEEEAVAAASG